MVPAPLVAPVVLFLLQVKLVQCVILLNGVGHQYKLSTFQQKQKKINLFLEITRGSQEPVSFKWL